MTLDFIITRAVSECRQLNHLTSCIAPFIKRSTYSIYRDYVDLFSMNVNFKVFAFFVFVLFYATQVKRLIFKQSFILSSDFVTIFICCVSAMKIKGSAEQIALDLFQNCDVSQEVSVTFNLELASNVDAVSSSPRALLLYSQYLCERNSKSRPTR